MKSLPCSLLSADAGERPSETQTRYKTAAQYKEFRLDPGFEVNPVNLFGHLHPMEDEDATWDFVSPGISENHLPNHHVQVLC